MKQKQNSFGDFNNQAWQTKENSEHWFHMDSNDQVSIKVFSLNELLTSPFY